MPAMHLEAGYALIRVEFYNTRKNRVVDSHLMTIPVKELGTVNQVWCHADLANSDIQIRVQELTRNDEPDERTGNRPSDSDGN